MGAYRRRWVLALAVTATLLLAPVLGAVPLGVDAISATDWTRGSAEAGATPGDTAAPATLGPPNWPAEPLAPEDVPGRHDVRNTSEYPHSTVGHLGATGTLISEYHVLTAAHVVTHENGTPLDLEELTFTPGLRAPSDGPIEAPFGRAEVVDVHLHPEWDGGPPDDDLAVLVLDRPVGAVAGSMTLPDGELPDRDARDLQQAGYVNNVTGNRQVSSTPVPQPSRVGADDGYHYYCGPLSHGDSGSPVWTDVDGTPTIVSVNSAFDSSSDCDDPAVGVRMDEQRTERVHDWLDQNERPEAKADLVVAPETGGIPWVDGRDTVPPGPIEVANATLPFGTTVYNNGPAPVDSSARSDGAGSATVEFLGVAESPATANGSQSDATVATLCTDDVSIGAYDSVAANCVADGLPEELASAASVDVYAVVDPDERVEEYERSPVSGWDGPQKLGTVATNETSSSSQTAD